MVFTSNTKAGFWSFKECIDKKNSSEEFKYTFGKYEDPEAYEDKTEVFYHPEDL